MADEITTDAPEGTGAAIGWGVHGVLETFIVDCGGRIAHKHMGAINAKALEEETCRWSTNCACGSLAKCWRSPA